MLKFKSETLVWKDFPQHTKRPLTIRAKQIFEEFEVETLEGIMRGKAGDYLVIGIAGEPYPVDRQIFQNSYDKVEV
jgi:hypothetical protein